MAINRFLLVGVFDERADAERAIEEMYNAGVPSDHISYSKGDTGKGGFLKSLSQLFGGNAGGNSDELINDLVQMGLAQDEAQYYAQEHAGGHTIVAVRSIEHLQLVQPIMQKNGAYHFDSQRGDRASYATNADTSRAADVRDYPATAGSFSDRGTDPYTDRADMPADYTAQGVMGAGKDRLRQDENLTNAESLRETRQPFANVNNPDKSAQIDPTMASGSATNAGKNFDNPERNPNWDTSKKFDQKGQEDVARANLDRNNLASSGNVQADADRGSVAPTGNWQTPQNAQADADRGNTTPASSWQTSQNTQADPNRAGLRDDPKQDNIPASSAGLNARQDATPTSNQASFNRHGIDSKGGLANELTSGTTPPVDSRLNARPDAQSTTPEVQARRNIDADQTNPLTRGPQSNISPSATNRSAAQPGLNQPNASENVRSTSPTTGPQINTRPVNDVKQNVPPAGNVNASPTLRPDQARPQFDRDVQSTNDIKQPAPNSLGSSINQPNPQQARGSNDIRTADDLKQTPLTGQASSVTPPNLQQAGTVNESQQDTFDPKKSIQATQQNIRNSIDQRIQDTLDRQKRDRDFDEETGYDLDSYRFGLHDPNQNNPPQPNP